MRNIHDRDQSLVQTHNEMVDLTVPINSLMIFHRFNRAYDILDVPPTHLPSPRGMLLRKDDICIS